MIEFINSNAALLVAIIALLISLRANFTADRAHRLNVQNKDDAVLVLLGEKRRELLNELDRQHATLATLSFVIAQEILIFRDCPPLNDLLPDELERLKSNLAAVEQLEKGYMPQRRLAEASAGPSAIHTLEETLSTVRQLSIHLEKDVAHEKSLLEQLRDLRNTAPAIDMPATMPSI